MRESLYTINRLVLRVIILDGRVNTYTCIFLCTGRNAVSAICLRRIRHDNRTKKRTRGKSNSTKLSRIHTFILGTYTDVQESIVIIGFGAIIDKSRFLFLQTTTTTSCSPGKKAGSQYKHGYGH